MGFLSRKKPDLAPDSMREPVFRGLMDMAPSGEAPAQTFEDAPTSAPVEDTVASTPASDAPSFSGFGDFETVEDDAPAEPRGRAKRQKKAKAPKPPKPAKVKRQHFDEEFSVPTMVMFDFCQGMTKLTDAEAHARALVEDFTAKSSSWIYCQPWRGGMAIEVQQGGGKAFLPEMLAAFDENDATVVAVPMSNRVAQVTFNEAGMLETMLLSAEQGPQENAFRALPGPEMKPYDQKGARIAALGVACMAVTGIAACFAMFGFFADKEAWAAPYLEQTPVESLPIGVQAQAEIQRAAAAGDCVLKLEYMNGMWTATTGYNVDGQCVKDAPVIPQGSAAPAGTVMPDGTLAPGAPAPVDPAAVPGAAGVPPVPPAAATGGV